MFTIDLRSIATKEAYIQALRQKLEELKAAGRLFNLDELLPDDPRFRTNEGDIFDPDSITGVPSVLARRTFAKVRCTQRIARLEGGRIVVDFYRLFDDDIRYFPMLVVNDEVWQFRMAKMREDEEAKGSSLPSEINWEEPVRFPQPISRIKDGAEVPEELSNEGRTFLRGIDFVLWKQRVVGGEIGFHSLLEIGTRMGFTREAVISQLIPEFVTKGFLTQAPISKKGDMAYYPTRRYVFRFQ